MRKSRFTEEQVIGVLSEHEGRVQTADCAASRRLFIIKGEFGGLEVSEARPLRVLEAENARLRKLLVEAMLDNAALKDVASKKW